MSTQATPAVAAKPNRMLEMAASLLAWFFIISLGTLALLKLRPPEPAAATTPAGQFSAERALAHVRAIAIEPHPVGSNANDGVRKYLLEQLSALGLNPQVIEGIGIRNRRGVVIARTHDVVGRLPGTANSAAIMLVAHYDSVFSGPGAADDGASVAAILEAVRALRAGPALKNDLIVLFTDGEEMGLLGADAFASENPWIKDVGLLLNFEARGDRGPSLIFETSPGNSVLIQEAARFAPHPMGSSLFYSLYKLLPNDTDFTVFRQHKIPGLNFAFGENLEAYHTQLDTPENLSLASLQHQGSYALSLTAQFGQMSLKNLKTSQDDIFFNWLGGSMMTYSQSWVLPGELLATVLLICIIALNVRRSKVKFTRIMLSLPAPMAILFSIPAAMAAAQWLISRILAGHMIASDSSANSWLLAGLVLLGICTGGFLFAVFRKRYSLLEISLSGLILLDILSWAVALLLPAGSYLLFWPLLLATLGLLAITLGNNVERSGMQCLAGLASVAVSVVIFAPVIYLLYVFLTLQLITVAAIGLLIGLFFTVAVPHLNIALPRGGWHLLFLLACALAAVGVGASSSHYSAQHPRRDSVLYSMNTDIHRAAWISYDKSLDPWATQFFSGNAESRPMPDYLSGWQGQVLSASASPIDLPPPIAEIKADENDGDTHKIKINVRSQRNASLLRMAFAPDVQLISIKIGERKISPVQPSSPMNIYLLGMDANGADLELVAKAPGKISFWLTDQSPGLPMKTGPRPNDVIAGGPSDVTYVCRKYSI